MIKEDILLGVINDFELNPTINFSIKEYKSFLGPENKEMIYIDLMLEHYTFSSENIHSKIEEIKKRIKNILSFDRVIIRFSLNTDAF